MVLSLAIMVSTIGLVVTARALFRPRPTLSRVLAQPGIERGHISTIKGDASSLWGRMALWLLNRIVGDRAEALQSDLDVMEQGATDHATERLGVAMLVSISVSLFGYSFGYLMSWFTFAFVLIGVFFAAFLFIGSELRSRADKRRTSLELATNELVGLVTVAISGGSGLNSSLRDSAWVSDSDEFRRIRSVLAQADVRGTSYADALMGLGTELDVPAITKLGQTVEMSASTGAKLTETLRSRLNAVNDQQINHAIADAKKASDQMATIMGAVVLGLTAFMTYPLVVSLLEV